MPEPLGVLLADDHPVFRRGLRALIDDADDPPDLRTEVAIRLQDRLPEDCALVPDFAVSVLLFGVELIHLDDQRFH